MSDLKILDFAVIIRNMVDLGKPDQFFKQDRAQEIFQEISGKETELFRVGNQVFRQVCSLAYQDIVHLELPDVQLLDYPKLSFMEDDKVIELFEKGPLHTINIWSALHRTGVLQSNMHIRFQKTSGYDVDEAIELIRLNLRPLAIKIPDQLCGKVELVAKDHKVRWIQSDKGTFLVGSLKDLTSELLRPLFIKYLRPFKLQPLRDHRCISSTLIQIYETNPACKSIEKFVRADCYGKELRGLGALDRSYQARTEAIIHDSFLNDLSVDEEVGVFTFGLSDLIIFDASFSEIVKDMYQQRKFADPYGVVLYNSMHYSCLLEWVYLEKYLIDLYSRLLSRSIAKEKTTPEQMLDIQKQSMHDLIAYQAGITPYPSREEFLEKARDAHRVPEMQENLEKKRDLATDYVIQEYTLRTNKSIQLVNIFISATAAFGLMEVVLSIEQGNGDKMMWGILTAALFLMTLLILWGINKVLMLRNKS